MIDLYEKIICKGISYFVPLANRISLKTKNFVLTILFSMIAVCSLFYMSAAVSVHLLFKCIIGAIILGLVIFFSIDGEVKTIEWDKRIAILWFAFGILRILCGLIVSVEYLPLACIWVVEFPCLFLVWNNRKDYNNLYVFMSNGIIYPVIIYTLISILVIPIVDIGYGGLSGNPNALGQMTSIVIALALVKCNNSNDNFKRELFWICVVAFFNVITILTRSRTTTLIIIGSYGTWMLYSLFVLKRRKHLVFSCLIKIFIISTLLLISLPKINELSCSNINIVASINQKKHVEVITDEEVENAVEKKIETDTDDSLLDGEEAEQNVIQGYVERLEGNDKTGSTLDDYSSGRIGIWKKAVESLNLFGHPSREHIVTNRNGDVGNNVHNNFLQFAYDNGIFAGILFLCLVIVSFIKAFHLSLSKEFSSEMIIYVTVAYIFMSLVTSINLPFLYLISFVYYVCFAKLFQKK